jgi:UDP-glucose 6-dehydrogenase
MNYSFNINICGFGFVGGSMGYLCERNNINYNVYDINKKEGNFNYFDNVSELVKSNESNESNQSNVNYYFICVPTPSDSEGNCNTSIVESVVRDLSNTITKKSIILVKSTVKPGTTRNLSNKYQTENVRIVFCPEFLRELTCKDDVYNTNFTLFGCGLPRPHDGGDVGIEGNNVGIEGNNVGIEGNNVGIEGNNIEGNNIERGNVGVEGSNVEGSNDGIEGSNVELQNDLKDLFVNHLYKHKELGLFQCIFKGFEECELFKYTLNTFFGVKILFFNEIYELCESFKVDYQELKSLFTLDSRIGSYGISVPGYDGKKGYGLSCLPKEIRGLKKLRESLGLPYEMYEYIDKRNKEIRGEDI